MKIFAFFVLGCYIFIPILIAVFEYNEKYKGKTKVFINHLSEGIALMSTGAVPAVVSSIALGNIAGMSLALLWWVIGVYPNNDYCFYVTTIATWIIGMILGIIGCVPIWLWIIYVPLFINAVCYIIRHHKSE